MVQYRERDTLFTLKGQKDSHEKLEKIFRKMGSTEKYSGRFYPGGHAFDGEMQEDAFGWFDRWLK